MKLSFLSKVLVIAVLIVTIASCGSEGKQEVVDTEKKEAKTVDIPRFDRDSAYMFIEKQMEFGPRVPGTEAHLKTRDYLVGELQRFGLETKVQNFSARNYLGQDMQGYNITGVYNKKAKKRLLLMAHWDSRFIADNDPVADNRNQFVPGANDGASGVGVLLEIARVMQENPADIGVDIVFFDLEDQGEHQGNDPNTWCYGSQYWSKNLPRPATAYSYGILLDMVGAKNALFKYEGFSKRYAPSVLDKIWSLASAMGYGNFFQKEDIGGVIDDHYFVNTIAGIPSIDIIDKRPNTETGFFKHWHTVNDDIDIIDKATLRAVGQVLTAVIYRESIDSLN